MTKEKTLAVIKEMIESQNDRIFKEAQRLLDSGGIDYENSENYLASKVILHVALLNEARQYLPPYRKGVTLVNNLKKF